MNIWRITYRFSTDPGTGKGIPEEKSRVLVATESEDLHEIREKLSQNMSSQQTFLELTAAEWVGWSAIL